MSQLHFYSVPSLSVFQIKSPNCSEFHNPWAAITRTTECAGCQVQYCSVFFRQSQGVLFLLHPGMTIGILPQLIVLRIWRSLHTIATFQTEESYARTQEQLCLVFGVAGMSVHPLTYSLFNWIIILHLSSLDSMYHHHLKSCISHVIMRRTQGSALVLELCILYFKTNICTRLI